MTFVIGLIIWLILSFVLASIAKDKGRSYGSFLAIGILLSPIIGFIILLAMGENKDEVSKQNISAGIIKKCPFCANDIKKEAIVCQFCGKDVPYELVDDSYKIEKPTDNQYIINEDIGVHLYPDIEQKELFKIKCGEIVTLVRHNENNSDKNYWCYVKNKKGNKGWCYLKYLDKIQ